jgi:hypothetical protein
MKLSEIDISKEYYAIPSWSQSSRWKRDIEKVERKHLLKVKVLSTTKYNYEVVKSATDDPNVFKPATNPRSYGLKVVDQNGVYWICKPADLLWESNYAEQKWQTIHAERELKEALEKQERQKRELRTEQEKQSAQQANNSIIETMTELLGVANGSKVKTDIRNDGSYENPKMAGIVIVPTDLMQRLIEKMFEQREAV